MNSREILVGNMPVDFRRKSNACDSMQDVYFDWFPRMGSATQNTDREHVSLCLLLCLLLYIKQLLIDR